MKNLKKSQSEQGLVLPHGESFPLIPGYYKVDADRIFYYTQLALFILHRLSWQWSYIHPRQFAEILVEHDTTEEDIKQVLEILADHWLVSRGKGRRKGYYRLDETSVEFVLPEAFGFIVWADEEEVGEI